MVNAPDRFNLPEDRTEAVHSPYERVITMEEPEAEGVLDGEINAIGARKTGILRRLEKALHGGQLRPVIPEDVWDFLERTRRYDAGAAPMSAARSDEDFPPEVWEGIGRMIRSMEPSVPAPAPDLELGKGHGKTGTPHVQHGVAHGSARRKQIIRDGLLGR